jgi:type I restriction enzyme R subunit
LAVKPVTRAIRVQKAKEKISGIEDFEDKQKAFLTFVLDKYAETGVE